MGARPRDSQFAKMFAVEDALRLHIKPAKGYDLNGWKDNLVNSRWFQSRVHDGNRVRMWITSTNTAGSCRTFSGTLKLGYGRRDQLSVVHALAHVLADREIAHLELEREAYHGRTFARCFLALVGHVWGNDAAKEMRELYKANKVKRVRVSETTREIRRAAWQERQADEAKRIWGDFLQERQQDV